MTKSRRPKHTHHTEVHHHYHEAPAPEKPAPQPSPQKSSEGRTVRRVKVSAPKGPRLRGKADGVILTSALVVFGMWGFRALYEGKVKPGEAKAGQFLVGFGFVFFALSVLAIPAPEFAGTFAILVAVGSVLKNGADLAKDVSKATGGKPAEQQAIAAAGNVGSGNSSVTHNPHPENQKPRARAA